MKILNLAIPQHSDIKHEIIHYPDGHKHFKMLSGLLWEPTASVMIKSRFNNMDDLFVIAQAADVLRSIDDKMSIHLYIPHVFGARCDRPFSRYETIDIKIIAEYINNMAFDSVRVLDPHSLITNGCIERIEDSIIHSHFLNFVGNNLPFTDNDITIICPDSGYAKRADKIGHEWVSEVIFCQKIRAPCDGKILRTVVPVFDFHGDDAIIFDDIIDGGSTFLLLAEVLRKRNVGKLYLAASHGIFSQGYDALLNAFDGIYCTNSVKELDPRINCMDVFA